jgi:hypothetical protein
MGSITNNTKLPWPPHRNTMIDVLVLGCGPIRTGEGAAVPFIGVHILGEIRLAGGFDTLAELRWEDQIGLSIPVQKSTIPQSTVGGLFMFGKSACPKRLGASEIVLAFGGKVG